MNVFQPWNPVFRPTGIQKKLKVISVSGPFSAMRSAINVIRLRNVDILQQLHIEELLLRKTNKNFCILNHGHTGRAIVVGFSGKIPELVNIDLVKSEEVRVIRRYTGGGTVVVDGGCIFVSFIMNDKDAKCKPYPREIMTWSANEIYSPTFDTVGLKDAFSLLENDYTARNQKIAGNAQTITKNRFVHHTSFLWQFDPANMKLLQLPKKRPTYRNDRDHCDFLTSLQSIGVPSTDSFCDGLVQRLHEIYDVNMMTDSEVQQEMDDAMKTVVKIEDVRRSFLEDISIF